MEYLRLCSLMVVWTFLINALHSSTISDVRYYGCFDDEPDRALGTYIGYFYTIEGCIAQCRQSRYTFVGLQSGGECWCGENYDRYGITYKCYDRSLQPCSIDRSNVCGGAYANSVFKVCPGSQYGPDCRRDNSDCGNRGADVNGQCLSTCPPGFRGAECDEACPEGSFGPGCEGDCTSRCVNNRCDPRLGYCLEGCKTGLVGPFCLSTCQLPSQTPTGLCPFCRHCKDSVCAGSGGDCYYQCPRYWEGAVCDCPHGKWGARCEHDCHMNCPDNCNKGTGHCGFCSPGAYGDYCEEKCSNNCESSCDKMSGYCDSCRIGKYGYSCDIRCPSHCIYSGCDRYTGNCLKCDGEYYGSTCEQTCGNCAESGCGFPNGECQSCEKGFYTTLCNERCPIGCTVDGCDMLTGDCITCKAELYGPKCEKKCADGCEEECDLKSGECDSCVSGKYGRYCNMTCGQCFGGQCHRNDGQCFICKNGYFGEKCDMQCPVGCTADGCDMLTGNCITCQPGMYGPKCENNCADGCEEECDRKSGECDSCVSGKYGSYCNMMCGQCSGGQCNDDPCSPCADGYFGDKCNMTCPNNCNNSSCDQNSGMCHSCVSGHYGGFCDTTCPVNCFRRVCDKISGECTSGCTSPFYGPLCDQECLGCLAGTCDTHGVCVDGCVDGKIGALCNETCPRGTFGDNCSLRCHCAGVVSCDPVSGRCDGGGCEDGWTGNDCQAEALQGGVNVVEIAAPAAVGILVIIVIITIVIVMLIRRKRTKKVDENPNLENIDSAYAEISNDEQPKSNLSTGYGPYEDVDIPTAAEGVFYENAQELKYQSLIGTYTNSNNQNLENIDNAYAVISNDDRPKSNLSKVDEPYEDVDTPPVAESGFYENAEELKDPSPIDTSHKTNNTITNISK